MRIANELEKVCQVCQKHFDELSEGKDKIYVFSIELDSQSIWGGLGDKDTDKTYYITKEGWLYNILKKEYGYGHYPDNELQNDWSDISAKGIEQDLNSYKASMHEVETIINFYKSIRKKYPNDFE